MSTNVDAKIHFLYEEYIGLKAEIHGRSRDQLVCITASLFSMGGLFSAVISDIGQFIVLLLVIPWILLVFGILWCDHHAAIHRIGSYLKYVETERLPYLLESGESISSIEGPAARSINNSSRDFGWETWCSEIRRNSKRKKKIGSSLGVSGFLHKILPLLYFFIPSAVSVIAYHSIGGSAFLTNYRLLEMAIYFFNLILGVIFLIFWYEACLSTDF